MRVIRVVPKPYGRLLQLVKPPSGDVPEALPWQLYSTRTFVTASTTSLTFFDTTEGDKSLSNMESAGQLPDPQFFEIFGFCLDVIQPVSSTAEGVTGAIDNVNELVLNGRGFWTFNLSNKRYGPFALSLMHATGGPTGFGWGVDNVAAGGTPTQTQYANNGIFDGGWWTDGNITIPPKVGFDVTLQWPATVAVVGTVRLRVSMVGVLHRRVL